MGSFFLVLIILAIYAGAAIKEWLTPAYDHEQLRQHLIKRFGYDIDAGKDK